jgi:hypothetical protein
MAIFAKRLPQMDYTQPDVCLKKMADHIQYLQDELERYTVQADKRFKDLEGASK